MKITFKETLSQAPWGTSTPAHTTFLLLSVFPCSFSLSLISPPRFLSFAMGFTCL